MILKKMMIATSFLAIVLFAGCGQGTVSSPSSTPESTLSEISSSVEPAKNIPEPSASIAEDEGDSSVSAANNDHGSKPSASSSQESTGQTATTASSNPFALDPAGDYELYAYNAPLLGYANMGYAYWTTQGVLQPELEAAVAAINNLPKLEKLNVAPDKNSEYGLMTVARDSSYSKTQFYLFEDMLTVNGTAYAISGEQYDALKKVMEDGTTMGTPVPQWFVYMNPNRVTGIRCRNENGGMQDMKKDNLGISAAELRYINVSSGKTYQPGSKSLDNSPFQAVYTFDNGVTYTVYVSDTTERVNGVTLYVESSDMNYACEYKVDGYISNYIESTLGMIEGPANPRTM